MKPTIRAVLAVGLMVVGLASGVPTPALAARTITLTSLTVTAQAKGEITLLGTVGDADDTATVEQYAAGQWRQVATAEPGDDDTFLTTVSADTAGFAYFRASLPASGDQPAVTSSNVRVYVFGEAESGKSFSATEIPTVTGDQSVGTTLQAVTGTWSPKADYFTYRWNRNGSPTNVTGRTYPLTGSDLGAYVTVTAVGWRSGAMTIRESRPTTRVVRGAFTTTQPEIVGRAVVGETLQAVVTGWTPTPTELTYQWLRDGAPIADATSDRYLLGAADVGTSLTVTVHATASGVEPVDVTSKPLTVPAKAGRTQRTFGDAMAPVSTEPLTSSDLTYTTDDAAPSAWGTLKRTRWDADGAYTHSQKPRLAGTLVSAMFDKPWTRTDTAEYTGTNPSLKNADVSFTVTARRFAIVYRGNEKSDAMVWIDSRPLAASPIRGVGAAETTTGNRINITLPERKTVNVRFAGPLSFTGVDIPVSESGTVKATPPTLTLGVLSDSFYEMCSDTRCMSRNAAPTLASLTGFRVWNMSESGTGYVAQGPAGFPGYEPSPYGSTKRFNGVLDAPLDALLIGGSINDGLKVADLHRPAVDKLLNRLEEERPDLPVVLLGIEPLSGAYRSPYWVGRNKAFTATLKSMVGRHQNVVGFIDPYTDPWLTGTGSSSKPAGDGNADKYIGTDGIHLNAAGQKYYQQRVVDALRSLPLPTSD